MWEHMECIVYQTKVQILCQHIAIEHLTHQKKSFRKWYFVMPSEEKAEREKWFRRKIEHTHTHTYTHNQTCDDKQDEMCARAHDIGEL